MNSNDPQELSFEERDSFGENVKPNIINVPKNIKNSIPQSSKQITEQATNTLVKNSQSLQTQVKTNNPEKLDIILNTIENSKNIKSNSQNYKTTPAVQLEKPEKDFNTKIKNSPNKSIPIREEQNQALKKEMALPKDEDERMEDISQYEMRFPEVYHGKAQRASKLVKQEVSNDGKILKIFENNKKEVIFPSGMRKEIYPDGYTIVFFGNKDIKQVILILKRLFRMEKLFISSQNRKLRKQQKLTEPKYSNLRTISWRSITPMGVRRSSKAMFKN